MSCAAALTSAAPAREVRKVVTVLFCDLVGSTALGEQTDPEALRALLGRYFERMSGIVESHGGTVEKFIGDAVLAVFGVPLVHEDDALRACRAAVEMRDALPELGIQGRIGVNTGEVVTGTAERLVTGDAVNVAARFEQAAAPGEVLMGASTHELVHGAVDAEPVDPLDLKGKSEPVPAFRLLAAGASAERRHDSLFVGREREFGLLSEAWERAVAEQRCELVTVVGEPGIGKSRLAAEALASLGARVVRGRCLPYGAGITYWPVVEVVKQLDVLPTDPAAAAAIRSLLGESDVGTSAEEIGWAFRKLLEEHAPLVVVFDDIQWSEETFLDLIEHVALLSSGAPLLLLCTARPELLDSRPTWPVTIRLEPLDDNDAATLIGMDVPEELRARITAAAAGNPLFISEMLAMTQQAVGEVEVPASLKALLAARLDQLDPAERWVLECGSVEGEVFHRGAVQALTPEEAQVTPRLAALVRRELIRSERSQFSGEDGFRFRHLLIRDTAYDALPKTTRAELHQRFAAWLEQHAELVELDEIVGYHLEQAARCLADLGQPNLDLAAEAAARLAAAGRRARWQLDRRTARSLLQRAVDLSDHPDVHVVVDLARVLETPLEGAELLDEAADRAEREGDAMGVALARAAAAYSRVWILKAGDDELERLALEALPLLEAAGDHAGLAEVWSVLAQGVYNGRCQYAQIEYASERANGHALLAGLPPRLGMMGVALLYGPRPVSEVLPIFEARAETYRHPGTRLDLAVFLAMSDRIDEARALAQAAEDQLREFGSERIANQHMADIERIAGNAQAEADRLRVHCDDFRVRGVTAALSYYAPMLGRALCALGEFDDVERLAAEGREYGAETDPVTQALWRQVTALVQAHCGNHADAERFAREAVEYTLRTDSPWTQGDALCDLATVLEADGRIEDALAALRRALALYEQKEIVPVARRTRERLAALQAPTD
jgi:class 3 adenylate cyclase